MKLPDFKQWASNLTENSSDVAEALKQAFEQGYSLGVREGLDIYWWAEQDKAPN
jgi:hypothetical protein